MKFSDKNTKRKVNGGFDRYLRKNYNGHQRGVLTEYQRLRFFSREQDEVVDIPSQLNWIYNNADPALQKVMGGYFEIEKPVSGLLVHLTKETGEFRVKYLNQVEKWAKEQTVRNQTRMANFKNMITEVGLASCKKRLVEDYNSPKTIAWLENRINNAIVVHQDVIDSEGRWADGPKWKMNETEMVKRHRKQAERHFEAGLTKMVERVDTKGMISEKCRLSKISIDVNIEATVTDGNQSVRLFTIIASGPVQRPHYRYLCK